jgi:hypothetical protein
MGTIIKLVVAALILNAAAQAGMATFNNYQFEDDVQQAVQFAGVNATDDDIVQKILSVAEDYNVPITASDIDVTHARQDLKVSIKYTKDVMLVPGIYTHHWVFNPKASVRLLVPSRK